MNNKQLAEMIKTLRNLRKKKLEEQNPKAEASVYRERQKFRPEHIPDSSEASPNDYRHRMSEGMQQSTLGADRSRKMNVYSTTKGALEKRNWGGGQSMKNRYESTEIDLGPTETGKKSKKEVELGPTDTGQTGETVTQNPTDNMPSTTGSTNKNTTIKERKEK